MSAYKPRFVGRRAVVALGLAVLGPVAIALVSWQLAPVSNANASAVAQPPRSCAPSERASNTGATIAGCGSAQASPGATVVPTVTPTRSFAGPPPRAGFHEFPADCTVTHLASDDPIVFPGVPGAAHNHTFIGNLATTPDSTPESLVGGKTSCQEPKDGSSYWFPTLLRNGAPVPPQMVTVYYKSDVTDYRTVLPFPPGFRLIVGDAKAKSLADFKGTWTCGNNEFTDIPASCPAGSSLIVRLKAPSCWDGVHLDMPDHKSHMAYPVMGVCPADHPVPLPMLQMKVPYKLPGGNTGGLGYSSGPSFTFHYDFMNGWDPTRQAQIIEHCVNGGRQCNGHGIDQHRP